MNPPVSASCAGCGGRLVGFVDRGRAHLLHVDLDDVAWPHHPVPLNNRVRRIDFDRYMELVGCGGAKR